jgi:hypothetical protein
VDCFQQALNIYRELGDPVKVAIILEKIGLVFEAQRHLKRHSLRVGSGIKVGHSAIPYSY